MGMGESHFLRRGGFWEGYLCLCFVEERGWSKNRGVPGQGEVMLAVNLPGGSSALLKVLCFIVESDGECAVRSPAPSPLSCVEYSESHRYPGWEKTTKKRWWGL